MKLLEIVRYLDQSLQISSIDDYANAINGLQLENDGEISRFGAAVDACEWTLNAAAENGIDFLLVHHGLFWGGLQPVAGAMRRKLKSAMDSNLAVYSAHLPLDAHSLYGNNALLAASLGLMNSKAAFLEKGTAIGRLVNCTIHLDELTSKLERAVAGPIKVIRGGPETCRRIGIVTGGAGSRLVQTVMEDMVDTFITGEGPHWTFTAAEELRVNVLYAGHYATETFGVKALAAHLSDKYQLPWQFIDHPTGM